MLAIGTLLMRRLLTGSALCLLVAPLHASAQAPVVVTVVAPKPAQEVSGLVGLSAAASGEGVVSVQFRVDGVDHGKPVAPGTCCVMWDSRTSTDGFHTVQAVGRDQFGNVLTSQPVTFLVNNFAPAPAAAPRQSERQPPAEEPGFTAAAISGALVKRAPEAAAPQPAVQPVAPAAPRSTATTPPATPAPPPRSASAPPSAPPALRAKVSCARPDPFEAIGGIGICISGEWVLLWKPGR